MEKRVTSEWHQERLDEMAKKFSELSHEDLCKRIAAALYTQDSCHDCYRENIHAVFLLGTIVAITCVRDVLKKLV